MRKPPEGSASSDVADQYRIMLAEADTLERISRGNVFPDEGLTMEVPEASPAYDYYVRRYQHMAVVARLYRERDVAGSGRFRSLFPVVGHLQLCVLAPGR